MRFVCRVRCADHLHKYHLRENDANKKHVDFRVLDD